MVAPPPDGNQDNEQQSAEQEDTPSPSDAGEAGESQRVPEMQDTERPAGSSEETALPAEVPPPTSPPSTFPWITTTPSGVSSTEYTSNDRILAALGYVFWLLAVVVLLLNETKSKPLLRDHAIQALGFAGASFIYGMIAVVLFVCGTLITGGFGALILWVLFVVPLVISIYLAYLAYTTEDYLEIPYLTQFMKDQGWLTRPA